MNRSAPNGRPSALSTTPYMLLAAACFARSSRRFHGWLLANPTVEPRWLQLLMAGGGVLLAICIARIPSRDA